MSKFWSPLVKGLKPYVPGEQPKTEQLTKLNTNENPYGPSPKVFEAIRDATDDSLRLYPQPEGDVLLDAVADQFGLQSEQVFVGNGSDEVLAHVFLGLFKQDRPLLFPDITYSFYRTYCGLYGINYRLIPLRDDFRIAVEDYRGPNGGIIFPNPNAPTGMLLGLDKIEQLLQRNSESAVVIDEAYIDFGGASAVALIDKYPNLLVVQTLSKSRALAGLRVGFAMGDPQLIEGIRRVKNSFNSYPLGRLDLAGAVAALRDREYFRQSCDRLIKDREQLVGSLEDLGFVVLPSAANFIFVCHPQYPAEKLAAALRAEAILVRHFRETRIENYLRITVGTPEQHQVLINALTKILA